MNEESDITADALYNDLISMSFQAVAFISLIALVPICLFIVSSGSLDDEARQVLTRIGTWLAMIAIIVAIISVIGISPLFERFVRPKVKVLLLYIVGTILIGITSILIWATGGVTSSVFTWYLELAVLFSVYLRNPMASNLFLMWRPVIIVVVLAVLCFITIELLGPREYSFSVLYAEAFLFFAMLMTVCIVVLGSLKRRALLSPLLNDSICLRKNELCPERKKVILNLFETE